MVLRRVLFVVAVGGCSEAPPRGTADASVPEDVVEAADVRVFSLPSVVSREAPTCAADDEAPLRTGDDVDLFRCTQVGAARDEGAARWPSVDGLPQPALYVDPNGDPNGDGTPERPLRTLSSAVGFVPAARTIVLSRGVHALGATVAIPRDLALVGAGARGTTLEVSRDRTGLSVARGARVAITGVAVRYADGVVTDRDLALAAEGATLSLDDVSVAGASVAIDLREAALDARRVTITRSARQGVFARANSRITLSRFAVRDGAGQGIRAESSHVALSQGLVAGHARHGIVLIGATDATGGRGRCADAMSAGALDCVDQVVSQGNGVAALYVADARTLEVRRATLANTRLAAIDTGESGDGLSIGAGAAVSLDPEYISVGVRGFGTAVLGNARVGILAQGAGARLSMRAAFIARNASGGVFLSSLAAAPMIGESLFVENSFAGIVAAPGSLPGIVQCNGIVDTRVGTVRTATATVQLADGVHLNAPNAPIELRENNISRSAAFGVLVNAGRATLLGNQGAENRYGVGRYGGAVIVGDGAEILGREATPMVAPGLAGAL